MKSLLSWIGRLLYFAKGAKVPIICWYLDNREKRTRWIGKIHPGESLEADLLKIKEIYEGAGFSIPLANLLANL